VAPVTGGTAAGRHAVVVGAGIAGLSAAAGLHRIGWRVTVLERAERLREAGAGISLLTNAQRALDQIGVGDAVRRQSVIMPPGGEGLRTSTGHWLRRASDLEPPHEHGLSVIVLPRPELHAALRDAVPAAAIRTGADVRDVTDDSDGALVRFHGGDGEELVRADLVIGADGVNSRLRRLRWPGLPPPHYSGHSVWRGIARDVGGSAKPGGNSWGRGLEFGRMPLRGDRTFWYAVANTPEGASYPDNHAEVRRRFGTWHDPIPALIAATPPETVLHHDVFELAKPLPSFVSGRVVLVGDAAHAMTSDLGQGACQALEDSVVLCATLADDDVPRALARYDELRLPRTQRIAKASRVTGERKLTEGRLWVLLRNACIRLAPATVAWQSITLLGDWRPPVSAGSPDEPPALRAESGSGVR
jgi:2-polyprenyl-6-methoxyphenol hydroxylase-like FAD-dependent oxidoreductase